jgi:DNA-binding CsgD family transcriptional regulator
LRWAYTAACVRSLTSSFDNIFVMWVFTVLIVMNRTKRELEILCLVAEGKTNKEIGDELFITIKTVKTHITNMGMSQWPRPSGECAGAALLFLCHEMIAVGIYGCLVAEGKTNKEIGDELFITIKTVKTHITNILSKLLSAFHAEADSLNGAALTALFPPPSIQASVRPWLKRWQKENWKSSVSSRKARRIKRLVTSCSLRLKRHFSRHLRFKLRFALGSRSDGFGYFCRLGRFQQIA